MITESDQYYKASIKNYEDMILAYQGFFSTYTNRIKYLEEENRTLNEMLKSHHSNNDVLEYNFDIPE